MKNLSKTILIALGMAMPLSVIAAPDDDVTIRMMQANEHATEAVTRHIELPEAAAELLAASKTLSILFGFFPP